MDIVKLSAHSSSQHSLAVLLIKNDYAVNDNFFMLIVYLGTLLELRRLAQGAKFLVWRNGGN